MNILFEGHAAAQRAGGIEAATQGLIASLGKEEVVVNFDLRGRVAHPNQSAENVGRKAGSREDKWAFP